MADYRVYTIGLKEGRIIDSRLIEAATDEEAMAAAAKFLKENTLEVWTGTKRVGELKPAHRT
jgi:hypothetical protein